MPGIRLEILIEDPRWRRIPALRLHLTKAAQAVFEHLPKHLRFSCQITVLLTTDAKIRQLSRDFRGIDKPTNVLSFPRTDIQKLPKKGKTRGGVGVGDIALGYQYIVGEAKMNNKMLINHTSHLLVHGILHLFGYDHMRNTEAVRMERLETRIMTGLGLPDPYKPQPTEPKVR